VKLQRLRRAHNGAALRRLSAATLRDAPQPGYWPDDDDWDDDDRERDLTCTHCSGTGGDPWNDGITPCEHCDGEGYQWWN
jgi:hypothetical protein